MRSKDECVGLVAAYALQGGQQLLPLHTHVVVVCNHQLDVVLQLRGRGRGGGGGGGGGDEI